MKKWAVCVLTAFVLTGLAGAQQAVLSGLRGRVEVRPAGSAQWAPAAEGQRLDLSDSVSTGFNSSVTVTVGENRLLVRPLTRMEIRALQSDGQTNVTRVHLQVGTVNARVERSAALNQNFRVSTPYSTASVRGTQFEFGFDGLEVEEGRVAFLIGQKDGNEDSPALVLRAGNRLTLPLGPLQRVPEPFADEDGFRAAQGLAAGLPGEAGPGGSAFGGGSGRSRTTLTVDFE